MNSQNNQNMNRGVAQNWATPTQGAVGLPWVGGKKSKCGEYITRFPDDKSVLVDLFAGGGSIGFTSSQKFKKIVMNDIDYNIISLYRYLAGNEDLRKILDFKHTKGNFKYAHKMLKNRYNCMDLEERAKYVVADVFQSFNYGRKSYNEFKYTSNYEDYVYNNISKIREAIHKGNVQFENNSAFDILAEDFRKKDVFWFVDPPYENKIINHRVYYKSMLKDWEHELLAHFLSICKGKFMLCGYRGEDGSIYDDTLNQDGFHCYKLFDTYAFCERKEKGEEKDKRVEYIWTNYPIDGLEKIDMSKAA